MESVKTSIVNPAIGGGDVKPVEAKPAPGPKENWLLGGARALRKKGILQRYFETWREHGDVALIKMGPVKMHLVAHPDDVKRAFVDNRKNYIKGDMYDSFRILVGNGLITSDGALWKKQRRILQPEFRSGNLAKFSPTMTDCAADLVKKWEQLPKNEAIDVHAEMQHLTMRIIGLTMFSIDFDAEGQELGKAFGVAMKEMDYRTTTFFRIIPLWLPFPPNNRLRKAVNTIQSQVKRVIGEYHEAADKPKNLLNVMMNATDPETGKSMGDKQLFDEVASVFLAGHETTAGALSWTFYLISQHPYVEEKVYQEVEEVLQGGPCTEEHLPKLKYTKMVAQEALRLYPSLWSVGRQAVEDDVIGGYHIPKKSYLVVTMMLLHRHPDFWDNPERFDPERFSDEEVAKRHKFAYTPFAAGERVCLGDRFAMNEILIIVSMVIQKYRMSVLPGHPVDVEATLTIRPKGGLPMTLKKR